MEYIQFIPLLVKNEDQTEFSKMSIKRNLSLIREIKLKEDMKGTISHTL